ncbi:MAG TPA: dipeptidase [Gemmatimonadaceae bacterium]|nr:dipeptidase [Gemmatimonadaceae bacterium]
MTPTDFITANYPRFRDELFDFLRIPSISARSEHADDCRRAATWFADHTRAAGMTADVLATGGHPAVIAEWRGAPKGAKTVLVYGHYDVQPVEPLDLWTSPPFEPAIRNGRIYARGSVDDKGQLYLHVKAIESLLKSSGSLPVNIVILAEGEEEVGSDHLAPFIEKHKARLDCDCVVISDSAMFAPGIPSLLSSLRGLAYFQIDVRGPAQDLHSGIYGGAVVNPAMALARMLATMHDVNGRVAIPGFYDDVRDWPDAVRKGFANLPFDEASFRKDVGAPELGGEAGYSIVERTWIRPTCEVNGMLSGYAGEGAKTVLPATAMAKVSCRLVPDQTPDRIERLMRAYLGRIAPPGVTVTVTHLHGGMPWRAELEGPFVDAARAALRESFGREPVVTGEGGSIPVVGDFQRILGAPVLLIGFGLPGENAHAPDEWMSEENYRTGIATIARLWQKVR